MRYHFLREPAGAGRSCLQLADVWLTAGYRSITVFIAHDFAPGTCQFRTIKAHELEHVGNARTSFARHRADILGAIRATLATGRPRLADDAAAAEAAWGTELLSSLDGVRARILLDRAGEDLATDAPGEYRRAERACPHWELPSVHEQLRQRGLAAAGR